MRSEYFGRSVRGDAFESVCIYVATRVILVKENKIRAAAVKLN